MAGETVCPRMRSGATPSRSNPSVFVPQAMPLYAAIDSNERLGRLRQDQFAYAAIDSNERA